ncbi:MAG: hypothetical protein ACRD8O_04270 [Bryobacteraceae bacterium]
MPFSVDANREFLRHTLATLAYRCGKTLRDAPPEFSAFRACPGSRNAGEILAHIGDLVDWAVTLAAGAQAWHDSSPREWRQDVERFFAALQKLDDRLASAEPLAVSAEQLFQGPIADALTHTGQIAMLRRVAGAPVRGENYFKAEIAAGRVGPEQVRPRREFD